MGRFIGVLIFLVAQVACTRTATLEMRSPHSLDLISSSFSGGLISKHNSCDGGDHSPALTWTAPPDKTLSFALLVTDLDSPMQSLRGPFVHWVLYNIPGDMRELPESVPALAQLSDGAQQGQNGFDKIGYGGPCPPGSSPHRYAFDLYALNAKLNLPGVASNAQVIGAMNGRVLAQGRLVARYQH